MIGVEGISASFGDVSVFDGVDLSVSEGTFLGVVGPNGAGKTTLLRLISAAITPDTGIVRVDGVDVHELSSRAASRLVAVVPQDTHLSFAFDVHEVVEMGRTPHRSRFQSPTREDRRVVERALEMTGVDHLADRSIDAVSGGERQRVLLSRAIAQDTPVVLLDEPTASLDVNHQVETLSMVRDLAAGGRTIVAAIHDLDLAARYCDELAVLSEGAILHRGQPGDVLTRATIEDAFDAEATVVTNPATATPSVTAFDRSSSEPGVPERPFVFGTDSTTASVVARLASYGLEPVVGPVPRGGIVHEIAIGNDVDVVAVDPFESVPPAAIEDTLDLARGCHVGIIVGDPDLAPGSILQALVERSIPVVSVIDDRSVDLPSASVQDLENRSNRFQPSIACDVDDLVPAIRVVTGRAESGLDRSSETVTRPSHNVDR